MGIQIRNPGIFTTVQDLGRFGYQAYGVSPAGVLDCRSAALANILAGNSKNEGVLEITLGGAQLLFDQDNVVAVCGAPMPMMLDNSPVSPCQAFTVRAGQTLSFQYTTKGMRAYIAFAGGLEIPLIMGSRSTHVKSGLGGYRGRALCAGDAIEFRRPQTRLKNQPFRSLPPDLFPTAGETVDIRVLLGPQDDHFTARGITTLFDTCYEISSDSDRMGYRLTGDPIEHNGMGEIITDGVTFGSIQVPPSGLPIIMMADRQTTGGYAKIATVITADLPRLAQCRPGTRIHFINTTIEQAQQLLLESKQKFFTLKAQLEEGDGRSYCVQINGQAYLVGVLPVTPV